MCSRELRRKVCAWESSGVKGTRAKLSAVEASAVPEDSAFDIDPGPLLLPANGEAASGTPKQGEEAGRGVPKPSAAELVAGLSRLNAAGEPMSMGKLLPPGRGQLACSNGSSSGTPSCCSPLGCELACSGCVVWGGYDCCCSDCCLLACRFTFFAFLKLLPACQGYELLWPCAARACFASCVRLIC